MPRDQRYYMTFPNDMHRHPKITRLPIEVRWTFFEMNGEARLADNDGRFPAGDAEFQWPAEHIQALLRSHPTRPLLVREGDEYVIREYAEHQQTKEQREKLAQNRADAGAKGGKAAALAKQALASAKQTPASGQQISAESESEIEDLTKTHASQSRPIAGPVETDAFDVSPVTAKSAGQLGVSLWPVAEKIRSSTGLVLDAFQTLQVSRWLLDKSRTFPDRAQSYVLKAIGNSAHEVAQFIHEQGMVA